MKIVIPGGSGHVGSILCRAFRCDGHDVVQLSRSARSDGARCVVWDGETLGAWTDEIDGSDVVINLAGQSVDCRYHARNRRRLWDSRILSTRAVGAAIARCSRPPRVWLQASTATIYAHRYDAPNDERSGILGGDESAAPESWRFSTDLATAWEHECHRADTARTRTVLMRSAVAMSAARGGIFGALLGLVRWGLGGRAGDGRQYVSWIHELDFVRAVRWLIEHERIAGPVNIAAPNPLPNEAFMRELREAWGIGFGLPLNRRLLRVGAVIRRTETELLLKSRRIVPGLLAEQGFEFVYPAWPAAARELCGRWRRLPRGGSEPASREEVC